VISKLLRSKCELHLQKSLGNVYRCQAGSFESLTGYVSITGPRQKTFIMYKNLTRIILLKEQLSSQILYLCLGILMGGGKPLVT